MHPVVSIALDTQPSPVFKQHFQDWEKMELPLGDPSTLLVMCSDGQMIACRYTSTTEFLDLLRTQRLMPLMVQLRERSTWSYLLLDGTLSCNNSGKTVNNGNSAGFDWAATQGALQSVQEMGVVVLTLQSSRYLQDQIYRIASRDRSQQRVRPVRDALFVSPAEDMLLALPGIGDERCTELLRMAGSPCWALDLLTHPETEIPGIGPATKKKIRRELGLPDYARLAVISMTAEQEGRLEELTREHNSHTTAAHPAQRAA